MRRGEVHTPLARAVEEEEEATGRLRACKSTPLGSESTRASLNRSLVEL